MVSQLCVRFTSKRWFLNMIHLMPCWYTCRFCIHLAFIYYVGPSNVVWNKFGMVLSSPPLKMLKVQWSQTLCMKWFLSYEERLCFFFSFSNLMQMFIDLFHGDGYQHLSFFIKTFHWKLSSAYEPIFQKNSLVPGIQPPQWVFIKDLGVKTLI